MASPASSCGASLRVIALCVVWNFVGCDSAPPQVPEADEPTPIVEDGVVVHEDDQIVPGFEAASDRPESASINQRADASPVDPRVVAIEAEAAAKAEKLGVEPPAEDAKHRTSMPDRVGTSSPRLGGVRKAVPIDPLASDLFGQWKVDRAATSPELMKADRVLFLADGRMRIWRGSAPEDGRWTWTASDGVKTGGLDGIAFSLGEFEREGGTMVISTDPATRVVLTPDRFFVAPKRLRPAASQP